MDLPCVVGQSLSDPLFESARRSARCCGYPLRTSRYFGTAAFSATFCETGWIRPLSESPCLPRPPSPSAGPRRFGLDDCREYSLSRDTWRAKPAE